jgi:small nuclear ribonucleoprotein (snRNP)-like protein
MIKRLFSRFKRYIRQNFNITVTSSVLALIISLFTMYYQFFNVKHKLLYAFLYPSVNEKLSIPMVYKNAGNQNEMILESNIELEIIPDDGSDHYFKRIGDDNKSLFPLIIAPGEYKNITLLGDYQEYFEGMLEQSPSGLKYRKIVNLDTLSVVITTKFISNDGIAEIRRPIGKLSFRKDKTFDRIDFLPIKLIELKSDDNAEMVSGSVFNADRSMNISLSDSLTSDQIEQIKFIINVVKDTTIKKEMIKFLKKKGINPE